MKTTSSRRLFLVQSAMLLSLSACKRTNRRADVRSQVQVSPDEEAALPPDETNAISDTTEEEGGDVSSSKSSSSVSPICPVPTFDIERIALAGEEFDVTFKCYGRNGSWLFAFGMKKYIHGALRGFYLVRENGAPLAYRAIQSSVDITNNLELKIQCLDHLPLNEGEKITIVFENGTQLLRSPLLGPLELEKTFKGKKVLALRDRVKANMIAIPEVIPAISQEEVKFITDELFETDSGTKFRLTEDLADFILTDLLGNTFAAHGENFSEYAANRFFIAYKEMKEGYVRTFVRLV